MHLRLAPWSLRSAGRCVRAAPRPPSRAMTLPDDGAVRREAAREVRERRRAGGEDAVRPRRPSNAPSSVTDKDDALVKRLRDVEQNIYDFVRPTQPREGVTTAASSPDRGYAAEARVAPEKAGRARPRSEYPKSPQEKAAIAARGNDEVDRGGTPSPYARGHEDVEEDGVPEGALELLELLEVLGELGTGARPADDADLARVAAERRVDPELLASVLASVGVPCVWADAEREPNGTWDPPLSARGQTVRLGEFLTAARGRNEAARRAREEEEDRLALAARDGVFESLGEGGGKDERR